MKPNWTWIIRFLCYVNFFVPLNVCSFQLNERYVCQVLAILHVAHVCHLSHLNWIPNHFCVINIRTSVHASHATAMAITTWTAKTTAQMLCLVPPMHTQFCYEGSDRCVTLYGDSITCACHVNAILVVMLSKVWCHRFFFFILYNALVLVDDSLQPIWRYTYGECRRMRLIMCFAATWNMSLAVWCASISMAPAFVAAFLN